MVCSRVYANVLVQLMHVALMSSNVTTGSASTLLGDVMMTMIVMIILMNGQLFAVSVCRLLFFFHPALKIPLPYAKFGIVSHHGEGSFWHCIRIGVYIGSTEQNAERICGADQNGDNLRINRVYLCISDHCSIRIRVRDSVRVMIRVAVADCCIQTAGESDKMQISHVVKTDQWRSDPLRSTPHYVVSLHWHISRFAPQSFGLSVHW